MTKLLQLFGLLQALLGAAAIVDSTGGFALDTIGALFLCFGILFIVLGSLLKTTSFVGKTVPRTVF